MDRPQRFTGDTSDLPISLHGTSGGKRRSIPDDLGPMISRPPRRGRLEKSPGLEQLGRGRAVFPFPLKGRVELWDDDPCRRCGGMARINCGGLIAGPDPGEPNRR